MPHLMHHYFAKMKFSYSQELLPVLKYVRGESLSQDHWLDLFRMIGLPRGTTLERLTFHDILSAAPAIIAKMGELKVKKIVNICYKLH